MSKTITFDEVALKAVKAGIDKLANTVKVTLGPMGLNVLVERSIGGPMVTKDGVSVAREIVLEDKLENLGATLVKEVAGRTNDVAGDGTSTATVLAQALVEQGLKVLSAGEDAQSIRRQMEDGLSTARQALKDMSIPVEGEAIRHVASISANDPEIGKLIGDVIEKVGKNGVISVEEGSTFGVTVREVEGLQFDRGYLSPYFVTNTETLEAEQTDAQILITDQRISSLADLVPLLESIAKTGRKDIVIIADDVDGDALATAVVNKMRGMFNILAVRAPEYGERKKEFLEDIAILTGGTVITLDKGIKLADTKLEHLGRARRVVMSKDKTTIIEGAGDKALLTERIAQAQLQLGETEQEMEKERLRLRIGKLSGGVAVIEVGAASEVEMKEKKHRIEDAVAATKAAIEEGIVAGGGVALIRVAEKSMKKTDGTGHKILWQAIESPLRQIALNAGYEPGVILGKVKDAKGNEGWNAMTNEITDLVKAGVIDPTKVTRCALENAVSVAIMVLTTKATITEFVPEKKD